MSKQRMSDARIRKAFAKGSPKPIATKPTRDQLLKENKRLRMDNAKLRIALQNASESVRAALEVLRIEREQCRISKL